MPMNNPSAVSGAGNSAAVGLAANIAALRHFWRAASAAAGGGLQLATGAATAGTGSAALTGVGTQFTKEFRPGTVLKNGAGAAVGTVLSVESDTAATLTANASVALAAEAFNTVPNIGVLGFGDSIGGYYGQFLVPLLNDSYGNSGGSLSGFGNSIGGTTSVLSGGAANVSGDFTYWPTGEYTTVPSGGVVHYAIGGGVVTGNSFAVYYVKRPGGGTMTVGIYDGALGGTLVDSITVDTSDTSVSLGIARFVLTTVAARTIRATGTAGTCIVIGSALLNRAASGVSNYSIGTGGLGLPSVAGVVNPAIYRAVIADLAPVVATYSMRESATAVQSYLQSFLSGIGAVYSGADWLLAGVAPSAGDAGFVPPTTPGPGWLENEAVRSVATALKYGFYDAYQVFGSPAGLTDPVGDVHLNLNDLRLLGDTFLREFNFAAWPGLIARVSKIVADVVQVGTSGLVLKATTNANNAGVLATDSTGTDVKMQANRHFMVTSLDGTITYAQLSAQGAGASFLPDRTRFGSSTGPALWAAGQGYAILMSGANINATTADFRVNTLLESGSTNAAASGGVTANLQNGGVHYLTLTGNVTSFGFSNPQSDGVQIEVHFIQDGTGSRTLAGSASGIKWAGSAPTLTTAAGKRDIFRFRFQGGAYYECSRSMNVG